MFEIEKSIVVDAPVEEIFAYVADPQHNREYYTDVSELKNLRQLPNGGYACTFMPVDMTIETAELVPNERIVQRGTACGPMDEITITTTFDRLSDDGKTLITHHEEHAFHGGFLGKLSEKPAARYFDRAAEMTMAALKARIESGTPAKALATMGS